MIWQWNEQIYHWSKYMFKSQMKLRLIREICKATALWITMEISASIPWGSRIKGRARKGSGMLKWACLAKGLVLLLVRKDSSTLAKSFPFFFLYHHLIGITYGKIAISPCHCPQTLRTSWKFRSRDVKSNLIKPLLTCYSPLHNSNMWMLPSHPPLASPKRSQEPLKNNKICIRAWQNE